MTQIINSNEPILKGEFINTIFPEMKKNPSPSQILLQDMKLYIIREWDQIELEYNQRKIK